MQVKAGLVLRSFNFGIVDEVDSILIDEARTPIIISGTAGERNLWGCTNLRLVCTKAALKLLSFRIDGIGGFLSTFCERYCHEFKPHLSL